MSEIMYMANKIGYQNAVQLCAAQNYVSLEQKLILM